MMIQKGDVRMFLMYMLSEGKVVNLTREELFRGCLGGFGPNLVHETFVGTK